MNLFTITIIYFWSLENGSSHDNKSVFVKCLCCCCLTCILYVKVSMLA